MLHLLYIVCEGPNAKQGLLQGLHGVLQRIGQGGSLWRVQDQKFIDVDLAADDVGFHYAIVDVTGESIGG